MKPAKYNLVLWDLDGSIFGDGHGNIDFVETLETYGDNYEQLVANAVVFFQSTSRATYMHVTDLAKHMQANAIEAILDAMISADCDTHERAN